MIIKKSQQSDTDDVNAQSTATNEESKSSTDENKTLGSSQVEPKADVPSSGDSKVDFYVTTDGEVIPADKYDGGNKTNSSTSSGAGKTKTYQTYKNKSNNWRGIFRQN